MGGSQSNRRVVVEDNDAASVVKISESVVKRIRGDCKEEPKVDLPSTCVLPPLPSIPPKPQSTSKKDGDLKKATGTKDDDWYRQTLQELEARNAELLCITNEQFKKAVTEVEQKFLKHTSSPVCQDLQCRVYECYLANQQQTLNCSAEVRAFSTCVERARQHALIRKD